MRPIPFLVEGNNPILIPIPCRSRLAVTNNQSCVSTPSEERSDPRRCAPGASPFLSPLPYLTRSESRTPRLPIICRAIARLPRSEAPPEGIAPKSFKPFSARAPRGYVIYRTCASKFTEERSDPRRDSPRSLTIPRIISHLLCCSRLAVTSYRAQASFPRS